MKQNRKQFPDDKDNRIQNLYYDVNITTIFNKNKLQKTKIKFIKYENYLMKYEKDNLQPNILKLQQTCWNLKMLDIRELRNIRENHTSEGYENIVIFRREYEKCSIEISRYITLQTKYNDIINNIRIRIKKIKTQ